MSQHYLRFFFTPIIALLLTIGQALAGQTSQPDALWAATSGGLLMFVLSTLAR